MPGTVLGTGDLEGNTAEPASALMGDSRETQLVMIVSTISLGQWLLLKGHFLVWVFRVHCWHEVQQKSS